MVSSAQGDVGWPVVPGGTEGGWWFPGGTSSARGDMGWPVGYRVARDAQERPVAPRGMHRVTCSAQWLTGGWRCLRGHGVARGAIRTGWGAGGGWGRWGQLASPGGGQKVTGEGDGGPGEPLPSPCPCPQDELQAWLQGLSTAITECRSSREKAQSLPLPPAPPEPPLPRKDKEKRFSFFPKKK